MTLVRRTPRLVRRVSRAASRAPRLARGASRRAAFRTVRDVDAADQGERSLTLVSRCQFDRRSPARAKDSRVRSTGRATSNRAGTLPT
jgi:hypothetical protein